MKYYWAKATNSKAWKYVREPVYAGAAGVGHYYV